MCVCDFRGSLFISGLIRAHCSRQIERTYQWPIRSVRSDLSGFTNCVREATERPPWFFCHIGVVFTPGAGGPAIGGAREERAEEEEVEEVGRRWRRVQQYVHLVRSSPHSSQDSIVVAAKWVQFEGFSHANTHTQPATVQTGRCSR